MVINGDSFVFAVAKGITRIIRPGYRHGNMRIAAWVGFVLRL